MGWLADWIKRHALVLGVGVTGVFVFTLFTWAERGYFCDQAKDHGGTCPGFWSAEHMHDWIYNMASNWQSDCFIGILLVVLLLKVEGPRGADQGDT